FSGSAIQFQHSIARLKQFVRRLPHYVPLRTSNERVCEYVVVPRCQSFEGQTAGSCEVGVHALTSTEFIEYSRARDSSICERNATIAPSSTPLVSIRASSTSSLRRRSAVS